MKRPTPDDPRWEYPPTGQYPDADPGDWLLSDKGTVFLMGEINGVYGTCDCCDKADFVAVIKSGLEQLPDGWGIM